VNAKERPADTETIKQLIVQINTVLKDKAFNALQIKLGQKKRPILKYLQGVILRIAYHKM